MNRKGFFAVLAGMVGLARAQDLTGTASSTGESRVSWHNGPKWQIGKALNNQCPVCGVMAPAYRRMTEAEAYKEMGAACMTPESSGGTAAAVCITPSETKKWGALKQHVDCARCNATFIQFAEGEKK